MDYIEIKGYKSIKSAKIDFKPINILIGANGSGKSNFLSFFEFLNRLYERKLTEYVALSGGEDKMLHRGSKITTSIYSKIKQGLNAYSFEIKKGEGTFIFVSEGLWYDRNPYVENPIDISDFRSEANIKMYNKPRAAYIRRYLNSFKKYHFHDTSRNSPFTQPSHIQNDIYYLYEKGNNLAAFLYGIQQTNKIVYGRILKTIQSIAPYFSDFYFQPNSENYIRLQWQDKYSDIIYGVNDLSDGTIRFIALATLFMQPDLPATIIIDEPELGLHPTAISKLAGMIKSAASKNCQIIVATQSTDLISHFKPEDIITVDQVNGESVFKRLTNETLGPWLEDYTIDDLWKRNIITTGQPNY
ncbi:MAG TPA: AAA family ATPase [Chitinophagaceae bacterium]|nr:AAA family ATPase [Chitinophagaceae bacterium]